MRIFAEIALALHDFKGVKFMHIINILIVDA